MESPLPKAGVGIRLVETSKGLNLFVFLFVLAERITLGRRAGLVVADVSSYSPVGAIGSVVKGDILIAIDDDPVPFSVEEALDKIVGPVGSSISLTLMRDGKMVFITAVRSLLSSTGRTPVSIVDSRIGLRLREENYGLLVEEIVPGSAIERRGLVRPGDLLISINGEPSGRAVRPAIERILEESPSSFVNLSFLRGGSTVFELNISQAELIPPSFNTAVGGGVTPQALFRNDYDHADFSASNSSNILSHRYPSSILRSPQSNTSSLTNSPSITSPATSKFVGLGLGLTLSDNDELMIGQMVSGGAAEQSGLLREGDILLSVDSINVTSFQITKVLPLIVGPEGSFVTLSVRRGDTIIRCFFLL